MFTRHLFLVGYDIAANRRRRLALKGVQGHAVGGQKSFYECWLTVAELHGLMQQLRQAIDPRADRVIFIRLDARSQSLRLGQAEPLTDGHYFHIT